MASRRNKRRLMCPTRLNRIDRSLRRNQSRGIFLRILEKPLFQQADHFGGMNNRIPTFDHMPYAGVIQIASDDYLEPAQSDFFPSYGPTRFRDDREITPYPLLQHEGATGALPDIELLQQRPPVCRQAARPQSNQERTS